MLYNVDRLTWGFRFHVPKFAGRDELYVVCDALICDGSTTDSKDLCDRSCHPDGEGLTTTTTSSSRRRRRLVQPAPHPVQTTDNDDDAKGTYFQLVAAIYIQYNSGLTERRQPHRHSGLATLPSVEAIP